MSHVHRLKDGQMTGKDEQTFSGGHVHTLPNGEFVEEADDTKTHVHKLPDGSMTPSGPIDTKELDEKS